ncbi:hypothetical protein TVAG_036390 [Trichomonas vaginalis G3]|uniref:Uncharacterized protein n=1 Tax=Trichomonas vaginalis (strain ATCC PRA-98 / G3) TaxID=412133 RepID=A2DAW0_TRIV3|nr:hypothetical protein TVAGG3_0813010 [Trichomonas vaginalis G3]EAY22613.1 hypothetical protein TVAG_036390 [Trichomonas vaginalis G3]KAI5497346.1 hypothetical protein TVAGG3_0813010 [Trichomonas vaginalis G3]|eukprot:XP_001583599.1 hypothetical protein [Trichomonas vaginalis G3]
MTKSSKIVLNDIRKELPKIKIIEPFQPEVIDCDSKDDFSEIISADQEKYAGMTTQKLNKIFHIPGYKVTKIKGEICLRNIKDGEKDRDEEKKVMDEIKKIKDAFNALSEQFELIKDTVLKTAQV